MSKQPLAPDLLTGLLEVSGAIDLPGGQVALRPSGEVCTRAAPAP